MRRRRCAPAALAAALGLVGCGGTGPTPIADGCTAGQTEITQALAGAPDRVALQDGSPLSRCVRDGQDDAELQQVGIVFHQAAERLRPQADAGDVDAGTQLGFLIGATRRGAAGTNGVMEELVRRIELVGGRVQDDAPPEVAVAVRRGMAAGERSG